MCWLKYFSFPSLFILLFLISFCQFYVNRPELQYKKWVVSEPILTKGPSGTFDDAAVKDPSIVYYNGKYHLFYTSKSTKTTRESLKYVSSGGSGVGYVSSSELENFKNTERFNLSEILKYIIVAPQIFYFEPHELWYIIAQTPSDGRPNLLPVYLTNPDIEDVYGWSQPQILHTSKTNNGFWIDFWVICDEKKAHLFFTDHKGSLFRMETSIRKFPKGFADSREETVLTERGENNIGRWRLHEASHIYFNKDSKKYFTLLEAVYPHPTRKHYWDSRNRFVFAMTADKLEGPWQRVEATSEEFLGDPKCLVGIDGTPSIYGQVSHPELIRAGFNQKLEIEDYRLKLLFQAFNPKGIPDNYDYDELPWELSLMRNY